MASRNMPISIQMIITEVVVMLPRSSGLNVPLTPARTVESKMYVMSDMIGMYISGELISSRGGRYRCEYCWPGPSEPGPEFRRACCRLQDL